MTMNIWDCHVHLRGGETAKEILDGMDRAGITRISLFARYPGDGVEGDGPPPLDNYRAAIEHVAELQAADPDRIYGLFWPDPRTEGILDLVQYALMDKGLRGIKMIPNHWSPCDEALFPLYAKMQELGKPIQFHSGILYGFADSSRFCRPVLYEALVRFPGLRFSLAHISWPWVDECIAVFGRFRAAAHYQTDDCQMWVDTCRGTPDAWRLEALQKAVPFCGTQRLMYGTDCTGGGIGDSAPEHIKKDLDILRGVMGLSEAQIEQFFWGAAAAMYA
jgi:uncharacterized protein